MPLYVYQVIEPDGSDGEVFEVMQRMSEPVLATHPESGKPVRRLIAAPNTVTRYGAGNISNDRLGKLGFTNLTIEQDGVGVGNLHPQQNPYGYQFDRTHLALQKDAPDPRVAQPQSIGRVVALPRVGGLHHRYDRRAA